MINLLVRPQFENDHLLFSINNFLLCDNFSELEKHDDYYFLKKTKFLTLDISTDGFDRFRDRPSLRNISCSTIENSIYTAAVFKKNNIDYQKVIQLLAAKLAISDNNRRLILRFLDPFDQYMSSNDVSCLAYIHYLRIDYALNVEIVYRASDVENELFYDLLLIYYFFVLPVYNNKVNISFYASSAQNIIGLDKTLERLGRMIK